MFSCPSCHTQLWKPEPEEHAYWVCRACSGRALRVSLLRAKLREDVAEQLWQLARASQKKSTRACPACGKRMVDVPLPIGGGLEMPLDACPGCALVWFDAEEFERLPPRQAEAGLGPEAKQALAQLKVELLRERGQDAYREAALRREAGHLAQLSDDPLFLVLLVILKLLLRLLK